jgi:diaminohydroxyphosphoribosylaminopyrimidine deaminase / 5-amino-6-(5-phosphoribosylamino)uracil reductase
MWRTPAIDLAMIHRCVHLAKLGGKYTRTNPNVGAVIVHQGRIIGEGYHTRFGASHAEVESLHSVTPEDHEYVSESTIYVSLEPCNHYGKTPPCTEAILNHGIRSIVIGCTDPNYIVAGKGIQKLLDHGCEVTVLEVEACKDLIRPFVRHQQGRPYVILKSAESSDGFIGQSDRQVWLTAPQTSLLTHQWRSQVDAILVGKNTMRIDRPQLNTRHFPGDNPRRVILDSDLSLDYHTIDPTDHWIVLNSIKEDHTSNIQYVKIDTHDMRAVLHRLFDLGIYMLMVEGGRTLHQSFLDSRLWDEARIITTSVALGHGIPAAKITGKQVGTQTLSTDKITYLYHDES